MNQPPCNHVECVTNTLFVTGIAKDRQAPSAGVGEKCGNCKNQEKRQPLLAGTTGDADAFCTLVKWETLKWQTLNGNPLSQVRKPCGNSEHWKRISALAFIFIFGGPDLKDDRETRITWFYFTWRNILPVRGG